MMWFVVILLSLKPLKDWTNLAFLCVPALTYPSILKNKVTKHF